MTVEKDWVMGEVARTAAYVGAKTDDEAAYERIRTVEVERELTWTEQGQIYGFRVLAGLIIVWLIWRNRSKIITLIRKLV